MPSIEPFPDPWVLSVPLLFASIISSAVYLHDNEIDFEYLKLESVSERVKLERIKMNMKPGLDHLQPYFQAIRY